MISENNSIGIYRVLRELARGSFSRVYVAQHSVLTNRTVAIKLMISAPLDSSEKRESFLQEARFLEMLRHPYILPIYDVGVHEGIPYLVTEYATYGSLRGYLRQRFPHILPMEESLTILSQIGQALDYAHQQHIIHRDLKPENILFNSRHEALLMDFGIATTLTTASIKVVDNSGTPAYMAPEQFRGKISKEGDQYALGCIAYELFTGHPPFTAPDFFALGFKHLTELPLPPTTYNAQLPAHMEQAILKALAKERTERYPDIRAFISALQAPAASQPSLPTLPAVLSQTDMTASSTAYEVPPSYNDLSPDRPAAQTLPLVSWQPVDEQQSSQDASLPPQYEFPVTPIPPANPVTPVPPLSQEALLMFQDTLHLLEEERSTGGASQLEWGSWERNSEPASLSAMPEVARTGKTLLLAAQKRRRNLLGRKGLIIAAISCILLVGLLGTLFFNTFSDPSKKIVTTNPTATASSSTLSAAQTSTVPLQSTPTTGHKASVKSHATPGATPSVAPGAAFQPTQGVTPHPTQKPTQAPTQVPTAGPTPDPTTPPTPDPTPTTETLTVDFAAGTPGVSTQYSYSGTVTVTVSGEGQASSTQWSDAFYLYTDDLGNQLNPPQHPSCEVLYINSQPTDNFVSLPGYQDTHSYTFTMTAPGGPLSFGVCNPETASSTGSYTITVTQN